jgi:ketosteroid isomerase-like protein
LDEKRNVPRDTAPAMSEENVEIVRQGHETFNRRDLDAYLALHHPDEEFTPYERAIEGLGPYRGHDDIRRWWKEAFEIVPDFKVELDELRDLGELTLVRGRLRGHGAGSGASFERTYWGLFRCRDQRIVCWHAYASEAEALEAAGLSE